MGLMLTFALARLDVMDEDRAGEASARHLAAALMKARSTAIRKNREIAVTIDSDAKIFRSGTNEARRPIEGIRNVGLRLAPLESLSGAVGRVRFYPDGTSSGGTVLLAAKAHEYEITVDWFSGRVELQQSRLPQ